MAIIPLLKKRISSPKKLVKGKIRVGSGPHAGAF
jgi:hypothetical protein